MKHILKHGEERDRNKNLHHHPSLTSKCSIKVFRLISKNNKKNYLYSGGLFYQNSAFLKSNPVISA
jgi:hypothetical protein